MARKVTYAIIASDKFTAVARRVATSTKKMRTQMRGLKVDTRAAGTAMTNAGQRMRGFSLAATGAVVGTLKSFGDLEQGVQNVLTLFDSAEEAEAFRGRIRGMSEDAIKLGFSIDDATKGLFDNVSALGANQQAFDTFKIAQKLAVGGVTSLAISVKGISAIVNAYGRETTDANAVANAFFTAQKKGTTTVEALALNIGKVAPIAREAGVGLNELLATTAQLTQGGLSTEEATTALRAALASLLKPGKEAERILKALGVPFGATQLKSAGLANTLVKLSAVSEKYPELLSRAIPNIRAFTAVASLQGDSVAKIRETMALINKDIAEGTGLNSAYTAQLKTFNKEMAITFGKVTVLAGAIGEALVPTFRAIGNIIGVVADQFSILAAPFKKFVAFMLLAAAVAAPILLIMGKLAVVAGVVASAIAGAFVAVPLAVIAAIAAAALAIGLVIAKFDVVKEKFVSIKDAVKGFFGFGGGDANISTTSSVDTTSKHVVDMTLHDPAGVIDNVKTKTTGDPSGFKLGVALADT